MNALLFSAYSSLAIHINNDLNRIGIKTILFTTNTPRKGNNQELKLNFFSRRIDWLMNALRSFYYRYIYLKVKNEYGYYQDIDENADYFDLEYIKSKVNIKPDYIFVLFDYRVLTTGSIKKLYDYYKVPIIWFLVDMKPMTGGCSYAIDCFNYQTGCNSCPAISSNKHNCFASETVKKKIKNLDNVDLKVITFSSEQYAQASSSSVFNKFKKYKFFFPINDDLFCVQDKLYARKNLNLDPEKKIVFWGMSVFNEPRKGFKYLKEALLYLSKDDCSNILLLVVGDIPKSELDDINIQKVLLGQVNMKILANAYQASDMFVCSSIADSGPTMVNQAIMCGTPVVAFDIGICGDIVISEKTGMLVKSGDSQGLYLGVRYLLGLDDEQRDEIKKNCYEMSLQMKEKGLMNNIFTILSDSRTNIN